jgi:hypothetical protein
MRGHVGTKSGLDKTKSHCVLRGLEPRIVHPLASLFNG